MSAATEPVRTGGEASLVRALGTWGLAAGIVNVTVGGGIFRLPASAAQQLGTAAPLAYVVCAVAMGLIVMCFAEAGSRVALTGGPYAYVEVAFGPFLGFLSGSMLWLVGSFAVSAVSTLFADQVGVLIPALRAPGARAVLLVTLFAVLTAINIVGVRQGTRLNTVATVAKLLPLLLLAGAGLLAIDPANLQVTTSPAASEVAGASVVLIFAFAGVESALVPSGEVRDTARTVPRAIAIAMIGVTLLYLVLHFVAQGTLGARLAGSPTPLADAAGIVLGPWGRTLMLVGAAVSMFGYVSGMTLATPRALYAFGRDGFLPRALASIHPRYRTPWIAIVVQSTIACALAISGEFERLAIIANVATLLVYLACCLAAWQLRRRGVETGGGTPFRVPGAAVVPWLACAVILFILSDVKTQEWLVVGGVLVAAALAFWLARARGPSPSFE